MQSNPFPSVCGRVCPQEKQCEGSCILYYDTVRNRRNKGLPVNIGALEKFVGDFVRISGVQLEQRAEPTGKRVAVVGAGPSGLACAYELSMLGHSVDVYEALPKAGGVMTYGIPTARLDRSIIDWEVERLKRLGVRFFLDGLWAGPLSWRSFWKNTMRCFGSWCRKGSLGIKETT